MISKNKIKFKLILSLITLLVIFSFTISISSTETATINELLEQLRDIFDSSSNYSDFQKNQMLLPALKELLESGIPFEVTRGIIENSVEKSVEAYNMKKIIDVILNIQQDGLPTDTLFNKLNEGLAKNVNDSEIFSVISTKAENLRKAAEILNEALQDGLEINGEEEIFEILSDSLENDVPQESLCWLVKTGTAEGRSTKEISEISEELSYLSLLAADSGLSPEEISLLFKNAIENSSNIEEICENIQNSLETKISTIKIEEGGEVKPSATLDSETLPTSSEEGPVSIGETPTQEGGEAPTETGGTPTPEPANTPSDETPPPPEN